MLKSFVVAVTQPGLGDLAISNLGLKDDCSRRMLLACGLVGAMKRVLLTQKLSLHIEEFLRSSRALGAANLAP